MDRKLVLGLAGLAGSGKDTAANYLVKHYGFKRKAFADRVRKALYDLNPRVEFEFKGGLFAGHAPLQFCVGTHGWEIVKRWPEVRGLLQRMGTEVGRSLDKDLWIKYLFNEEIYKDQEQNKFVISDVRFENEAHFIHYLDMNTYNTTGVVGRIIRPGVELINDHISEQAMGNSRYDFVVINEGTEEELGQKVMEELERLDVLPC